MPIFQCNSCGQKLDIPAEMVNMDIDCPSCGKPIAFGPSKSLTTPTNGKRSYGYLPILSLLLLSFVALFIFKSCGIGGGSAVADAPPSVDKLETVDIAGIKFLSPDRMETSVMRLPAEVRKMFKTFNAYKTARSFDTMKFAIVHAVYVDPSVNLDGSAQGTIAEVENLPSTSSFTGSFKEVMVDGLEGREVTMHYLADAVSLDHYALVFARGGEYWQIQIIGPGAQYRSELEALKNAVFESVRVSSK